MSTANSRFSRPAWVTLLAAGCVVLLAVTVGGWWLFFGANDRRVTAYFDAAVGIYPRGDVRILGVAVGSVNDVVPEGDKVRVDMSLDRDVPVPADAGAVAVAPSIVSDRYVQLAPQYQGGPQLSDGAVISAERTATPVELDEIYQSLNDVTEALGPEGANSSGDLNKLLATAAENLDGNGEKLSNTLRDVGDLGGTLSGSSAELFATVDNLQKFSSMLAANDDQVRQFNTQLRDVSGLLSDEREDLSAAMAELTVALGKIESFINDNRSKLKSNVDQLNSVAEVLAKQKSALDESLTNAPLAVNNLTNSYNGASGTLDTRAVINELNQPPLAAVCKLLSQRDETDVPGDISRACENLGPLEDGAGPLPSPAETLEAAQQGDLPPLPLAGQDSDADGGGAE